MSPAYNKIVVNCKGMFEVQKSNMLPLDIKVVYGNNLSFQCFILVHSIHSVGI